MRQLQGIESMREMLNRLDRELTSLEALFDEQVNRDDLTGVLRRNAFQNRSEQLLNECRRNGLPCGVILIDLDHFKRLNDSMGHQMGDEILRQVGNLLRSYECRDRIVSRYGGEEFAITVKGDPSILAEEIRLRIEQLAFTRNVPPCTASIGTRSAQTGESMEDLIRIADEALYRAKNGGRNRVEAA